MARESQKVDVESGEQTRQKNRIRGALALGPAPRIRGRYTDPKSEIRQKVRRVLLTARDRLSEDEQDAFFEWLNRLLGVAEGNLRDVVITDLIKPLLRSPRIPLKQEFEWIKRLISPNFGYLRLFREKANKLNVAFWADDSQQLFKLIDEIEAEFGPSVWFLETKLAVLQRYGGLDGQKAFLKEVKLKYQNGIGAFIAHYVSIRNEPRSTLKRYSEDVLIRIEELDIFSDAKTYLRYRLADQFEPTNRCISAVLRAEQGQGIIDIYETVIGIFQKLVKSGKASRYIAIIESVLTDWRPIDDFRIAKLLAAIGVGPSVFSPCRNTLASELLLTGKIRRALRIARSVRGQFPDDFWSGAEAAFANALLNVNPKERSSPWTEAEYHLSQILARGPEFENSAGALAKLARNFQTLPTGAAMADLTAGLLASRSNPQISISTACLNTKNWGPEDLLLVHPSQIEALAHHLPQQAGTLRFWRGEPGAYDSEMVTGATKLVRAFFAKARTPDDALGILEGVNVSAVPSPVRGPIS